MTWPLQPTMFHKRQNSLSRYFASAGKIDKSANCLVGHVRAGLEKINVFGPRAVNGLDVASYGWSGPDKSWTVPSLTSTFAVTRRIESQQDSWAKCSKKYFSKKCLQHVSKNMSWDPHTNKHRKTAHTQMSVTSIDPKHHYMLLWISPSRTNNHEICGSGKCQIYTISSDIWNILNWRYSEENKRSMD